MSRALGWWASAALLAAIGAGAALAPRTAAEPPRLAVVLVVDQLRADYLERFRAHYQGGLDWLLRHGAHFPDASYRHSATFTAAGHATIATGLHPARHGVVGNSWREPGRGSVYCVEDDRFAPVGGGSDGMSPLALRADALGDRLKARRPDAKVYAVSTKNRSAILLAGKRADGAFWFEPSCGCLVSSSYYGDALPAWLAGYNAGRPAAAYAGKPWNRLLDDAREYERLSRRDRFPTEADGVDTVFPHERPAEGFERTLAATPFSDEITLGAATAALRSGELGTDGATDLLLIGLSATDSVGHRYGPFSQEAMDNHLRLDRALGRFLDEVDSAVGLERVVFALSADHGAIPLVEHLRASGVRAERSRSGALWAGSSDVLAGCGGGPAGETVDSASGTRLYWNEQALRAREVDLDTASECVAEWLRRREGVAAVLTSGRLSKPGGGPLETLFENAYFAGRSPHVQVHRREHYYEGGAFGTGHGSAHAYDRDVPVLLAGAGIAPGTHEGAAGPEDIAPTLGVVLGVEMPVEPDARILREALRRRPD